MGFNRNVSALSTIDYSQGLQAQIQLTNLSLSTADNTCLIAGLSLSLAAPEKLALIGAEGVGKSTLLAALANRLPSGIEARGSVRVGKVGYLPQQLPLESLERTPCEFLLSPTAGALLEPEDWFLYEKAQHVLRRCGFSRDLLDTSSPHVGALSGGERVRLQIARLLLREPDTLLLDEPTSHLDLATVVWLEEFIQQSQALVIFVSHEEALIERCATAILHLQHSPHNSQPHFTFSRQRYADFLVTRERRIKDSEQQAEQQTHNLRVLQRNYQALNNSCRNSRPKGADWFTKMRAERGAAGMQQHVAKLRKKIETTERVQVLCREERIKIDFPARCEAPSGKIMAALRLAQLEVGQRILSGPLELTVRGAERHVIAGANGCGKSSLLKRVLSDAQQRDGVRVGYMPQLYPEIFGDGQVPVLELLAQVSAVRRRIITILASLGFQHKEMLHSVGALSGGQQAKVLLARLVLLECNFLLLDEPSTNLSPLSNQVWRQTLRRYPGAMLVVTHDRKLIKDLGANVHLMNTTGLQPIESDAEKRPSRET